MLETEIHDLVSRVKKHMSFMCFFMGVNYRQLRIENEAKFGKSQSLEAQEPRTARMWVGIKSGSANAKLDLPELSSQRTLSLHVGSMQPGEHPPLTRQRTASEFTLWRG